MTKVKVLKDKYIKSIKIFDHSDYAEHGEDIVCASISSMMILAFNTCETLNSDICEVKENDCCYEIIIDEFDENIDIVLNCFVDLLSELKEQYPNNITLL